jgi:endonuclease/exonuclease/phosphatase family metal-dependent hydrolase
VTLSFASAPLRIVSYNVRYFSHALRGLAATGACKRGIAAGLAALWPLPEIVCLQEVETISLRSRAAYRRRSPQHTQLESFMHELEQAFERSRRRLPYEAFYFRAHSYKVRKTPLYTTGLAILVNVGALGIEGHNSEAPHLITHHHVERLQRTKQTRICAHMKVFDAGGRRLHIFNTHLSLPTPFARTFWTAREKMGFGVNQLHEARTLATFVREQAAGEPFIVCGDFNSPPGSPVYRYLTGEAAFESAQARLGLIDPAAPRGFPTAGLLRLRMHLDHLFSGGGVEWVDLDGTVPFGDRSGSFFALSDHVPIIGRFAVDSAEKEDR